MREEHLSSPRQSLIGWYNAQVLGSGSATVNVYETIAPRPVDPSIIEAAIQKLSMLPLDRLPAVHALPPASRLPAFARNPSFVGREAELAWMAGVLKAGELATERDLPLGKV